MIGLTCAMSSHVTMGNSKVNLYDPLETVHH